MRKNLSLLLIFSLLIFLLTPLGAIKVYHYTDFRAENLGQHVFFDVSGEPWTFDSIKVTPDYLEIDNGADSERFIATVTGGECKFTIDVWDPDNTTGDATIASWTTDASGYSYEYESYTTGDTLGASIYGDTVSDSLVGQTFTPSTSHVITSVKAKLYRVGTVGTLTVEITDVDNNHHPTGGALCSGTIDASTLTTDSVGLWYEITLGSGALLSVSTEYAIVLKLSGGDSSNHVVWKYNGAGSYSGGIRVYTSGGSWTDDDTDDMMFEEWGNASSVSYQITNLQPSQLYAIYIDGSYDDSVTTDATGLFDWSGHSLSSSHSVDIKYGVVGISLSNTTFEWGSTTRIPEGTYTSSQSTVITNTGNVAEDFNVKFSQLDDGYGNLMSLTGDCAVTVEWSLDDTNWTAISDWDTYVTISTDVAPNDTVTLYVRIKSPYSQTCYSQYAYTSVLTVQGVAS